MARYGIEADTFDGGLNTKANLMNVPLWQTPDSGGIIYDDYGAIQSERGLATLNSDAITNAVIDGLATFTPKTMSAQIIACCGGRAHVITGTATAFNEIASSNSIWTTGENVEMHQFEDLLFFSNGYIKPYKFNGTNFTQMGVSANTEVMTAACDAAGGNLNGAYTWVRWGVNSYAAEGDYGSATAEHTITSGTAKISGIPTAPASAGIDYWKIGRNTAGASAVYWYLTDVSNGVTSFTDNLLDASLATAAPTDQGEPKYFKYMLNYLGRMWGAGDGTDNIYFSKVGEPETFPSTNAFPVGNGDGMDISGLAIQQGIITISKSDFNGKSAIYLLFVGDPLTASNPANWYLTKADSPEGSESHRAMVSYSNLLTLVNRNGVFSFAGRSMQLNPSETTKGSLITDAISFEIEPDIQNIQGDYVKNACAINYKNKVWFSWNESTGGANNAVWIYDYARMSGGNRKKGAWSKSEMDPASQFIIHEGNLYGGSAGGVGYVYQYDTGRNTGGAAYASSYYTAPIFGKKGHEDHIKDFKVVYLTVESTGSYNMSFSWRTDSGADSTFRNVDLTAVASQANKTVRIPINASGRYLQLRFYMSTKDQYFIVKKFRVEYTPRGLR